MAEVLAKQPRPRGPRLTIVTNAGGPGVLATDALIARRRRARRDLAGDDGGAQRASCRRPGATTTRSTSSATPPPERYAKALEIAASDPSSDGLLVILTPQAMTDPTAHGRAARPVRPDRGQAGPGQLDGRRRTSSEGAAILREAGHPDVRLPGHGRARCSTTCGATPTTCARSTRRPTPARRRRAPVDRAASAATIIDGGPRRGPDAPHRGRVEAAPRRLRHPDHRDARSPRRADEAVAAADAIGYPVVVKLYSRHDHPQDRRRRRAAEPAATRTPSARRTSRSRRRSPRRRAPSTSRA